MINKKRIAKELRSMAFSLLNKKADEIHDYASAEKQLFSNLERLQKFFAKGVEGTDLAMFLSLVVRDFADAKDALEKEHPEKANLLFQLEHKIEHFEGVVLNAWKALEQDYISCLKEVFKD